jgi:enamine deaminase RidA (YjgF/YER057c/UK114 family)
MEIKHLNPDTLLAPRGYSHVVSVEGAGRLVFISGQVAVDKEGKIVGQGDLKVQMKKAAENLVAALAAVGARPADIVKMNTYVVNYTQNDYSAMREARAVLFPSGNPPASTLIGVKALAVEGLLVEIEAIAALR